MPKNYEIAPKQKFLAPLQIRKNRAKESSLFKAVPIKNTNRFYTTA